MDWCIYSDGSVRFGVFVRVCAFLVACLIEEEWEVILFQVDVMFFDVTEDRILGTSICRSISY
jgi:hypothetical protein